MSEQLTDKQIEQIRRDVAKAYHDLMIDLALKGEGVCGNRRFWKDENNEIRWEDLPDGDPRRGDAGDHGVGESLPVSEPADVAKPAKASRAQRNRRAALIAGRTGTGKPVERSGGGS
jgi:hypothetical protein